MRYAPSRLEILVGPLNVGDVPFLPYLNDNKKYIFKTVRELYPHYELQNIANHRAVVIFPYAVFSYGITELYAMGLPLFVPDPLFLLALGTLSDWKVSDKWYCGADVQPPERHPLSSHTLSPEGRDHESNMYWVQFSDFYQLPHITMFSNWSDLVFKLDNSDFQKIHDDMVIENKRKVDELETKWSVLTHQILSKQC